MSPGLSSFQAQHFLGFPRTWKYLRFKEGKNFSQVLPYLTSHLGTIWIEKQYTDYLKFQQLSQREENLNGTYLEKPELTSSSELFPTTPFPQVRKASVPFILSPVHSFSQRIGVGSLEFPLQAKYSFMSGTKY